MSGELILRASIYETEAHRNRAIELFGQAFDIVREAARAASSAAPSGVYELPALSVHRDWPEGDREKFLAGVTKTVDRAVWSHLLQATGLDKLMDRTAKDQFRAQIESDPPPATAENCQATLEMLVEDRDTIFKRGIAVTFSKLDRRFRSHDGFKIGARMVLDQAFGVDGWWNHWRRHDETLIDVERTFALLDGQPQPDRDGGIVGAIKLAKPGFAAAAYEAESPYFRAKVFKNGNVHLWFKRDDLLERVNQLLADWYGAALGAAPDVADRKHAASRTPAKNFGFFPTPEAVVHRALSDVVIREGMEVLEPSAGRGAFALAAARKGGRVTCVEIQSPLAHELQASGRFPRVVCADFLDQTPEVLGRFDLVLMNPPFDRGRDVDHVTHALGFLKPGGQLVAIMSASTEFREDRKTTDFRSLVERMGGRFSDLPAGSFAEVGTNVNTCYLSLRKAA